MEKRACLSSLVIVLGVLGLVLQCISHSVPAWFLCDLTFDDRGFSSGDIVEKILDESLKGSPLENKTVSLRTSRGLWAETICVKQGGLVAFGGRLKCKTVTYEQLREKIGASRSNTIRVASLKLMDHIMTLQGLVTSGGIISLFAVIVAAMFVTCSVTRCTGFSSAIAWTFGAILIFAAVGLQGNKFKTFNDVIEILETVPEVSDRLQMKSFFPWAIVVSGTGALLNLVAAVLISILAYYTQDPIHAPGVWHKLSSQAV